MTESQQNNLENMRVEGENSFLKRVKNNLERLEIVRLSKMKVYQFRKKIGIPLAIVLTPICAFADWMLLTRPSSGDDDAFGITFMVLGGLYWWVTQPKRDYAKAYKKDILPKLSETLGLKYRHKGKIPLREIKPSKIVPSHDRYTTDDYFEGSYKNVGIKFSEIDLEVRRRSNKRTYYVSVFKGLAILLEMDRKKFNGHTILQKNEAKFIEWFKEKSSGMKRANMVDPEFEKAFDAYTTDQVEARYLIDPKIIEELKSVSAEYDGKKMTAAYFDNKVLVMIASKTNHFEPADLSVKATDPISILSMRQELLQILSLIDRLDLYDPYALQAEQDNVIANPPDQDKTNEAV